MSVEAGLLSVLVMLAVYGLGILHGRTSSLTRRLKARDDWDKAEAKRVEAVIYGPPNAYGIRAGASTGTVVEDE